VYVHLMGAHAPYAPPPSYRASFLEGRNLARRIQPRHTAQLIKDLTAGRAKKLNYTERSQLKALYRADAAYHDEVLGRLLAAMEKSGLLEDSLFIYTSDHGEEFYEHGRVGHGTGLWNEQVHVPLIVRRPGQGRRIDVDTVVGHVDIVPTILEALTVDVPAHLPGRSLLELMDGGGPSDRGLLLQHWTGRWGIQLGPWKLQRRPTDERVSWSWGPDEDEVDPAAAAITHRLLRLELARAYADLAGAQDGSPGIDEVEMSPELLEQLQGLGYFDQ